MGRWNTTLNRVWLSLAVLTFKSLALEVGDSIIISADAMNKDNSFQCAGTLESCPPGPHDPFGHGDGNWCNRQIEPGVDHLWVVHCEVTDYVCPGAHPGITGEAWTPFPGPDGFYRIGVGMFWKANGPQEFWIKLNGEEIFHGEAPWYESWCGNSHGDYADGDYCLPIPGGCVERQKLVTGDTVVWGGVTKWGVCPGDEGEGRGNYSAFYKMSFTLLPGSGPVIKLDKDTINFAAIIGGADAPEQSVTASNAGDGSLPSLTATKGADAGWLNLSVSGTSIKNSLNLAGKTAGSYATSVVISGEGAESDTYEVCLDLYDLRMPENPLGAVNGLQYKYYEGTGWTALPDFAALSPNDEGTVTNFSIAGAAAADNFAFEYSGFINVPADSIYTFYLQSDNGSRLYLGTTLVVENNEPVWAVDPVAAAPVERRGSVALKQGKHAITVQYHQTTGPKSLNVRYSGPGITKKAIPNSELFITPSSSAIAGFARNFACASMYGFSMAITGDELLLLSPVTGNHRIIVQAVNGACAGWFSGAGARQYRLDLRTLPAGIYFVHAATESAELNRKVVVGGM
jgi:hypothetical protein